VAVQWLAHLTEATRWAILVVEALRTGLVHMEIIMAALVLMEITVVRAPMETMVLLVDNLLTTTVLSLMEIAAALLVQAALLCVNVFKATLENTVRLEMYAIQVLVKTEVNVLRQEAVMSVNVPLDIQDKSI
jgi:hypothetical protein